MSGFNLYQTLSDHLVSFMLIYMRFFFFFMTCLIFRREYVSPRIVIVLASVLTLYQFSIGGSGLALSMSDYVQVSHLALVQAFIGYLSGVCVNLMFDVFMGVGQFTSTQVGLSIANQFDPRFGMVTPLSRFYILLAIILFFNLNGHLILIDMIMTSYTVIPIDTPLKLIQLYAIIKYASIIFMGTVSLSLTILIVILLTNITLAIMTKFAPQINLFSVGISFALIIGFMGIYLSYNYVLSYGNSIIQEVLQFTNAFLVRLG